MKRSANLTNFYLDQQQQKKKTHITKIRNERRDIATNLREIKRIIRECYQHFYTNKLNNQDEMNKFLETQKLPKVTQEEIRNLTRLMTSKEIESINKNLLKKKIPGSDFYTGEFYKTFKEELTPILPRLVPKN